MRLNAFVSAAIPMLAGFIFEVVLGSKNVHFCDLESTFFNATRPRERADGFRECPEESG